MANNNNDTVPHRPDLSSLFMYSASPSSRNNGASSVASDTASAMQSDTGLVTRRTSSRPSAPLANGRSLLSPARPSTSLSSTRTSINMPASATERAVPSNSELKNLISEQSAALLRELRHQVQELRSTMDHERRVGHKEILAESTTQLELQLAKMKEELRNELKEELRNELKEELQDEQNKFKEELVSKLMEDVKSSVATSNQQLTTKFGSTLNARLKAIVDKVDELRTDFEDFEDAYDGVPSLLLKLAQSYAKNHNNLAAAEKRLSGRLDVLETSTTAQRAPQPGQLGAETSATRTIDQLNEGQAVTAKVMDQQQSIALIQAATTAAASLGGQAKVTLSVTANSFTFSINNGGPTSSLPTTSMPASSSGQNLDGPRSRRNEENDTTMPPAKRLRTGEADGEHDTGGSRDRSASETLIGDDEEEGGAGQ